MPIYFLIGLTILILVIAVWATVAEEDEEPSVMIEQEPEWKPVSNEELHEYRKAA
ncbi:MAG: hypothetical protein AABZ34_15365 [Nitrospirota bacterium]